VYVCKKKSDADIVAENFTKVYYELEKQEMDELMDDEEEEGEAEHYEEVAGEDAN
jgi:hypothetical protein